MRFVCPCPSEDFLPIAVGFELCVCGFFVCVFLFFFLVANLLECEN